MYENSKSDNMIKTQHYEINSGNLIAHELIGLNAKIVKSTDKNKVGINGKIVDESKKLLVLETISGEKIIPKEETTIEFDLNDEKIVIDGKMLVEKPENRIKKHKRR